MGFFPVDNKKDKLSYSDELLHRMECKACPLNRLKDVITPHMEPTGAKDPDVYILGEGPGGDEDKEGEQFVGVSGQLLRANIPHKWKKRIRWNNVVRTRPPDNRTPTHVEIECCRPSIESDIVKRKPTAIFGFGTIPMEWGPRVKRIADWRGRRVPVNIAGHKCWFYIFHHPSYLYRIKKEKTAWKIGSEDERAFHFDMKRAFKEVDDGLPDPEVHTEEDAEKDIILITGREPGDLQKIKDMFKWAMELKEAGFDYEGRGGLRPYAKGTRILTAAIGTKEISYSFPVDHEEAWNDEDRRIVRKLLIRFLRSKVRKIVHNAQFEMEWSAVKFGRNIVRDGKWGCTMTQAAVLDERTGGVHRKDDRKRGGKGGPLSLGFLTKLYFGINIKKLSFLDMKKLDKEDLIELLRYNAIDGKYHYLVYVEQRHRLNEQGLLQQYQDAMKCVPTCALTQVVGVPIDLKESDKLSRQFNKAITRLTRDIQADPDIQDFGKFNPASSDDVIAFFQKFMKFKEGLLESGKYSTDKDVMDRIDHPVAKMIVEFRKESKKESTYIYRPHVWPDGLLHQILNLLFTVTGRTSSDSPNLQNMPARDQEAKKIRKQIVAPFGHSIVAVDYGQIEFRVLAMMSKAKTMIKALWEGYDVHGEWAQRLVKAYPPLMDRYTMKDPMKVIRKDMRTNWTFPICFGSQLSSVCEGLQIPEHYLEPEWDEFRRQFPEIFTWHDELHDFYKKYGFVETMGGRRRRAPMSFNKLINSPVQGTTAELVLHGMNTVSKMAHDQEDWYFQPILNIHDDLTFILPDNKLDHYLEPIIDAMLDLPYDWITVPITLEASMGQDLASMSAITQISNDKWLGKL